MGSGDNIDWEGETGLEGYTTFIDDDEQVENDEYIIFQNTLMKMEQTEPVFYQALTANLSNEFTNVSKTAK